MGSITELFQSQFGTNSAYIEELFHLYQQDRALVGETWASYFDSVSLTLPTATTEHFMLPSDRESTPAALTNGATNGYYHGPTEDAAVQERVYRMISAFRGRGHLKADINPLTLGVHPLPQVEDVEVDFYHFTDSQMKKVFNCSGLGGRESMPLGELIEELQRVYCGSIGFEFTHLLTQAERLWLQEKIEQRFIHGYQHTNEQRTHRLKKIIDAEAFESELHRKYIGHKRFSLEGLETVIPMMDTILEYGANDGVKEAILGMAHRGRLNVLVNTLGKPLEEVFSEFEDQNIYTALGSGDVKYHMGFYSQYTAPSGNSLLLHLAPNPSHLEFVDPVVEGIARGIQDFSYERSRKSVLPILLHGDAAFAGQGVVFETLNMARVDGFNTGGTIHIILNNQIGFTANPDESRSSTYCTDMAKAIEAPIFHVNCENIEAACWVAKTALEFRNFYGRDVVIDLYGYRKYGHNEGDDPSFTQPLTYSEIKKKKSIAALYSERLQEEGVLTQDDVKGLYEDFRTRFHLAHEKTTENDPIGEACAVHGRIKVHCPQTGVPLEKLHEIAQTLVQYPDWFTPHPKLQKILEKRVSTLDKGEGIDWGFAETLAFGSLQNDGVSIRLCGQDSGRGTFSQRHLALRHYEGGQTYFPLQTLEDTKDKGFFEVINSTLSEAAVLGFEFGYSTINAPSLVLWEAQFGDFANGAQVAIDQFISSSEAKWNQRAGIVMLLPHGYEGQGPEHSSARLERYLQVCAEGNMVVCYPSISCQYFHLLRRQGLSSIKRPLIMMTPKSLLRHAGAACTVDRLTNGSFQTIIHEQVGLGKPKKIVFVTGKMYHDVAHALAAQKDCPPVTLVRLEQLYPFPAEEIEHLLNKGKFKEYLWVQEEPENMGAFRFINHCFLDEFGLTLDYFGRPISASTATGSAKRHAYEQTSILESLIERIFEGE